MMELVVTLEEALELYEQQGITWLLNDGQCFPVKDL